MRAERDARALLLRVVVLVVVLLPVWYAARGPLAALLAPGAERLLDATVHPGVAALSVDGPRITMTWAGPEERARVEAEGLRWRRVPGDAIHVNVVLFLALALATPALTWPRRALALGLGLGVLYGADVLTLFAALRWQLVADFGYRGPDAAADRWIGLTYYWPYLFLISVGNQLAPVVAWIAALAVTAPTRPSPGRAARNAPCPCGSGRKYKRCCGRAA